MSYFYVFLTVILTAYGQVAIKWQVLKAGAFPEPLAEKVLFLFQLLLNPWVVNAFATALLASIFWMAAMTRLQLSHTYPFMSMAFVLIMVASGVFFNEIITPMKITGIMLIVLGIVVGSQG